MSEPVLRILAPAFEWGRWEQKYRHFVQIKLCFSKAAHKAKLHCDLLMSTLKLYIWGEFHGAMNLYNMS